jgi:putative tricarboxylic transport membrane protein
MQMWIDAFLTILHPSTLIWVVTGSFIGIFFGALPGIGSSLTMTLLLPFTFKLVPTVGLPLLISAWSSAVVGGSISSILLNTPGTGGNVATCFDGFPLAEQGKAKIALGIGIVSSAIGGIGGAITLYVGIKAFSRIILLFGPPELFLLAITALLFLSVIAKSSPLKGLIIVGVGMLVTFIGFDIISGYVRFGWGTDYLYDGIPFITIIIGLFAISRMLELVTAKENISETKRLIGNIWEGIKIPFKYPKTIFRSLGISTIFGFIPGLGVTAASLISYNTAQKNSSEPEKFGKGSYEGVVAPEVANNSVSGGAMIPALCLGIPGNSDSAVFLVALMMYGIAPGRAIFESSNSNLIYLIIASMFFVNFVFVFLMSVFSDLVGKVTTLPLGILAPFIFIIALTGAYSQHNNIWDVVTALIFGLIGYGMRKFKYPVVPLLMAIILGPLIEGNFGRALLISDGSYSIFYSSVLSKIFLFLIILAFAFPFLSKKIKKYK